jgi:cathepsin B
LAKKEGLFEEVNLPYTEDAETPCPEEKDKFQRYFLQDYCVTHSEEGIKKEIYKYGPVVAVVPVYRDFLVYNDGVYQVLEGTSKFQSGQALKVIGWDKDPSTGLSYWIVENTWGDTWGKNGFAHIAVGQKQLYIEDFVLAPHPRYEQRDGSSESSTSSESYSAASNSGN